MKGKDPKKTSENTKRQRDATQLATQMLLEVPHEAELLTRISMSYARRTPLWPVMWGLPLLPPVVTSLLSGRKGGYPVTGVSEP